MTCPAFKKCPGHLFAKKNGFSLIEIMVVAAMLAGLALVGMQLMKNQQDATVFAEAKNEELTLTRNLQMALVKKGICQKTFANKKVGDEIDSILLQDESALYMVNTPINGLLKITSLRTVKKNIPEKGGYGSFDLIVAIERIKKGVGVRSIQKSINIQAEIDESGFIQNCYSDIDSTIETTKIEMCQSLGGNFNNDLNKCTLNTVLNNSDSEVVSKALMDQVITQLRAEFDQKLQAIKNSDPGSTVDLSALELKALSSCDGPSVRFRYQEAKSSNCQKEMQFRLCESGKWGEWSGSFTYPECN